MQERSSGIEENDMKSLRVSLMLNSVAGCLAMVYVAGTTSPAFVAFMQTIGASELDFGLLGGIPLGLLALQFVGALITNIIPRRKGLFMVLIITGRLLYIPLALVPALVPSMRGSRGVLFVLLLFAVSGAMMNIASPLWLSWMADLIPRRILNTYWGRRQQWMYVTWTASFLGIAAFTSFSELPIDIEFSILATVAVAAGVTDIVLFTWVREPRNTVMRGKPIFASIIAPVMSPEYRAFVVYSCVWAASAMFAAAFMQIYSLKVLGLTVWQTTLVWCAAGVGIALVSRLWGRLADRYGHRPILAVCVSLKPLVVLAFLLVTPRTALWLLPPIIFVDSLWEGGIMVASNGYMLKIAPQANRSMFIAAIMGLAGICGGLGAVMGGVFLGATDGFHADILGRPWGNYHLLFAVNFFMRTSCVYLAYRVREPKAATPERLLHALQGIWPMRVLMFPIGMYRKAGLKKTDTVNS